MITIGSTLPHASAAASASTTACTSSVCPLVCRNACILQSQSTAYYASQIDTRRSQLSTTHQRLVLTAHKHCVLSTNQYQYTIARSWSTKKGSLLSLRDWSGRRLLKAFGGGHRSLSFLKQNLVNPSTELICTPSVVTSRYCRICHLVIPFGQCVRCGCCSEGCHNQVSSVLL